MSLFYTESGKTARQPKTAPKQTKISPDLEKHLTCAHCPLDRERLQHAKMLPTGSAEPVFYFIGEAPGAEEDARGEQFVGASGRLLRDLIPSKWARLIRWNNTLRCRPPGNREPAGLELACCRRLQVQDIEQTKPRVIVGFGNVPLEWMLGPDRQIGVMRGRRMPVKVGKHVCWFYPITHPAAILRTQNEAKTGAAVLRAFERDVQRVFEDIDDLPPPDVEVDYYKNVHYLKDYGRVGLDLIEGCLRQLYDVDHAVDIETDRLRPYHKDARILTLAAGIYGRTIVFPWMHPEARWSLPELSRLRDMVLAYLLSPSKKWAQSARFEMEWFAVMLKSDDVLYKTRWGDTLGQAHILDERGRGAKSLDVLTQIHFGFRIKSLSKIDVKALAEAGTLIGNSTLDDILPYNALDAKYTDALALIQEALLEQAGLSAVYEERNAVTPALVQMQMKGVHRNLPVIKDFEKTLTLRSNLLSNQIMQDPDVLRYVKAGHKFSPTSNPDLLTFFRDFLRIPNPGKSKTGGAFHKSSTQKTQQQDSRWRDKWSVDEETLAQISHPVAAQVLELRTINKNLGYVTPLLDGGKYVHGDGLVHASYSPYITVSGRLACEDPNQQNYPRRQNKEIRGVICAVARFKFVAFDYGQLEWRVGAGLSRDAMMIRELHEGKDIHGDWTDEIGGRFIPKRIRTKEGRKSVRDSVKQYWTFANLYGNVLESVAADLSNEFKIDIRPEALRPFFEKFWGRYPQLQKYQERLLSLYWEQGYVETGTGQRRHEPMSRNEIINHPLQGTAGHLVIDAQRRISEYAYVQQRPELVPIMNIHDDLCFYLPDEGSKMGDCIELIARTMCQSSYSFLTDVPLTVEISVGSTWADKQEIATYPRDFK
jgi:uracil-DNA glycosylase family 4